MEESVLLSRALFSAVAKRDYDALADLYGGNAKSAVASYLAMKSRWRLQARHHHPGHFSFSGTYWDHVNFVREIL